MTPGNNGQTKVELVSPTKAAKILGVSKHTVDDWIEKYNRPGQLCAFSYGSGQQMRVNLEHLRMIIDAGGVWPGDVKTDYDGRGIDIEADEDNDGDQGELFTAEKYEPEPAPPARAPRINTQYLYLIQQNGKTIDTWLRIPRQDEIHSLFGTGSFIIKKVDTVNGNITVEASRYDISNETRATDPVTEIMSGLERAVDLSRKIHGNGNGGGGNTELLDFMKLQLTLQNNLVTSLIAAMVKGNNNGASGGSFDSILDTILKMQDIGLMGASAGKNESLIEKAIDRAGDVLENVAPALAARFTGGPAGMPLAQPGAPMPPLPKLVPAAAPPAAQPTTGQGQAVNIQPIKPPATPAKTGGSD